MGHSHSVCVIGAGMIGRHHASSLLASGFLVTVVDPINPNITNTEWFEGLDHNIISKNEIFIVSTTARHHFEIVGSISRSHKNKIIVIEKPLFCNRSDYLRFDSQIAKSKHKIFCNLPYFYHEKLKNLNLREDLGVIISYSVYGSNWGLACNILHDVSIIDVLSNKDSVHISNLSADIASVIRSKRVGYMEVFGSISFLLNEIPVKLVCDADGPLRKVIEIEFERGVITIDVFSESITTILGESKPTTELFLAARASETTGAVVEQLAKENAMLPAASRYSSASLRIYEVLARSRLLPLQGAVDFPFS